MRPAAVTVRALGAVEATVAGRLVDLGTPKQRALLALLVARLGQPVTVEMMQDALWSGDPPPSAAASLHAYVANLRRVLEPGRAPRTPATVLRTCPRGYVLDRSAVDVDADRFGEHAAAGWQAWDRGEPGQALTAFEAGLALWRGQAYVEAVHAPDVVPEVARLEELRLSVVEARCAALLAVGAHQSVAELEALAKAHPLRERGMELLSLALYRAGRQAEALDVLRTLQRRLADELGIDPGPSLRHLEREILNQSPALDRDPAVRTTSPVAAPAAPRTDDGVFVGRVGALRHLEVALADAAVGRGRVVAVSGEPGIGKTRLLRRFADRAAAEVLWVNCPEHADAPPLWPWEQILRAAGGHRFDAAAGTTVRRFDAIVHHLTEAARAAPLVVVLDHVHRADPDSLRLLAHLAESVPASRLLLAVSYRSGEAEPLAEAMAALARTGMTRIELRGLSARETRMLASTILRRDVSVPVAEALRARSDGNPFFLRELVTSREEHPDQAHPVPPAVREVVTRRVARLPRTAADFLAVAAVAGRGFDIEVTAEAASIELEAALEAVDAAVAAGLIVEDPRRLGWFRFNHALVAETLYERTGRLRRARLHRRIGAAAARAWAGASDLAAEVARHWLLCAELDPGTAAVASTHAAAAARVADTRHAFDDAVDLWRQALVAADLAADLDTYPLLIGLGTSLCRGGQARDGLSVFVQAMDAAGQPDSGRLVDAATTALRESVPYPVDYTRLVLVLERALPRMTEPAQRSSALACLSAARRRDAAGLGVDHLEPHLYAAS
ncbi:BTAD domain-containing putative transcriptional regulator [Asanoa iriomotensis]|uniref:OmpR/PhoB-type domain-containing protein n=1 Tax=Asanoa iriomotensis TaxID=234613 RepID=A0ABQ4C3K6_9ACTN|nr:BTAD domain-containing putative transcriptional regulator [Asanoa iriomotensis]GIF57364.1 hypothetical protein Air01nite_34590 [Asanoa iriomotensis]